MDTKGKASKQIQIMARKRAERARRQHVADPEPTHKSGAVVEIEGPAKVDHSDHEGVTKTDHQGALGLVQQHYYSRERREQMVVLKTEDNALRTVPESRLRDVTTKLATPNERSHFGPSGLSQDRWDEIFGKKTKTKS